MALFDIALSLTARYASLKGLATEMNAYIFRHRQPPASLLILLALLLLVAAGAVSATSHTQQQDYVLAQSFIPPGGGGLVVAPSGAALNASIGQPLVGVSDAPSGAQLNHGAHVAAMLTTAFIVNAKLLRDFLLGRLNLNELQRALLDVNGDGVIDVADHVQLIKDNKTPAPE
jgi:hypothetical protein